MKKIKAFFCTAVLAVLLFSCAGGPAFFRTRYAGPFFITTYGETVPAHDDSPVSDAELDLSLILADTSQEGLREVFRAAVYGGLSAEEHFGKVTGELKTAYRKTMNDTGDWSLDQSWTYSEEQTIILKEPFAVLTRIVYTYMGGAHGFQKADHYVFDFRAPKQITIKNIADMSKLRPLTDRELRRYSQSVTKEPLPAGKPLSTGIFSTDTVIPDDYFPASDGLHLQWNPYDIAPYTYGTIEITISWQDLDGILKEDGVKLAETFRR